MDEGKIVLIGNETDVLHCGYSHAIKDNGKRYPSAVHYTHSMILSQLNVDENVILELLCVSAAEVPSKAHELLSENMPRGYDMESLASYLQSSRQSYTMMGLRLRVEQDKAFEKGLLDTNDALLIVCDKKDKELGIGMDEQAFMQWMKREKVDAQTISYWMRNEHLKPPAIGENKLGIYLMWLRLEVNEQRRQSMLMKSPIVVDGLSMDNDDNPVKIKANDQVISLQGIFRPLSNYFPLHIDIKGLKYRSVEHYAYEKLFDAFKLDDKMVEKIQTTVNPLDVPVVAYRVISKLELDPEAVESKMSKMDRWRQSAMKRKFNQYDYLAQLLLSTGNAIIVDCAPGESMWTCGSSEAELQHLLTKKYVDPTTIINWMIDKDDKNSKSVSHLKGNKTGLLLMELREKFAHKSQDRIPLVSPLTSNLSTLSPHVICFTAESIWHPLYPAEIRSNDDELLPSPAHFVAHQAIKYFSFNKEDSDYVLDTKSSLECWERLHETIEWRGREMEREQSWWMERRQKAIYDGLKLLLEQHPPLLRALLDTGDSMLVYCARFSSIESELSIGMRERDLRVWLNTVGISTDKLLELCLRPLAFRPAYLGGNRLGILLMQLRREFILRGVFPHTLPELQISVETMLGSDSPTENMLASDHFDVLDSANYTNLFVNPLFLLAKDKPELELMVIASYRKLAPRLVTVDEEKIGDIMHEIDDMNGRLSDTYLCGIETEDLRAVFMKLCHRLRGKMAEVDQQQQKMSLVSAEVNRLQVIRRGLEETRDRHEGRIPGGRDREREEKRRDRTPPRRMYSDADYKIPTRRRSPSDRANDRLSSRRDNERDRRRTPVREREREKTQHTPAKERERGSPPRKKERAPTPPPPAPKPVKAPRPPDAELSEGEILSSDED